MVDIKNWIQRADEILNSNRSVWSGSEKVAFATSMLTAFYGPESTQMRVFLQSVNNIEKAKDAVAHRIEMHAIGTIKNTKVELESGLIKSVRALIVGEIVSELLALAKEILTNASESAKNVGAVLVASAFEDTVRRMGSEFAGVVGRPALQEVIITLKDKDVLRGGEPGIAQSYLKFRNDSLHADWANVQRSQVDSCLAFVESLLGKHFS